MKNVSIIGLGWLGKQIANNLDRQGFIIKGTTRTQEKKEDLLENGWEAYQLNIANIANINADQKDLFSSSVIILTIPPSTLKENYAEAMKALLQHIREVNPNARIFYTSSTSVYGSFEKFMPIDENSPTKPKRINAIEIVKVEKLIAAYFENYCILRLGGLVGENRNPANYMSNRKNVSKRAAVVNLIHADDICEFISFAISKVELPKIINLVSPEHPQKMDYYIMAVNNLGLIPPKFDQEDNRLDKKVDSLFLQQLSFKFKYPSPEQYPELISQQ